MNIMNELFDESVRSSACVDPEDGTTLPPFYLCYSNLQEIADSAANDGYASPLLYKYCLPTELSEFNWLAITASISPIISGMDATDQLKATHSYLFTSHKPQARTIGTILVGGSRGHFTQMILPQTRQEEFIDRLMTPVASARMQLANPDTGIWPPIAPLFYKQSLANFLEGERINPAITLPTAESDTRSHAHAEAAAHVDSAADGKTHVNADAAVALTPSAVLSSELHNLAASGKDANESHDAPQHTAASVSTDFQSQSKFFTVSNYIDVVLELSNRFQCKFVEHRNHRGTLIEVKSQRETKIPWASARHFVSDKYVAKVYRVSSVAGSSQFSSCELPQALHESAATAYVCKGKSWFHDVFGVLINDSDAVHIHICMIRHRLDSKDVTPNNVSDACISLLISCGVMHGDGHLGNAKCRMGSDVIELLDFERAFMIRSSDELISMIAKYAKADHQGRQNLLQRMKKLGMDATRLRFKAFVENCLSSIKDWTLDEILSVFKGLG